MSSPIVYHPCPVKLPADLGWERDIRVQDNDIIARNPSFDRDTLFYDVFRSPDHRKIIALGPQLRNLATRLLPLRVYCHGRKLRYRGSDQARRRQEYMQNQLQILEIFADEEDLASDEPLELVFRWKSFEQRMTLPPNPLASLPSVTLTLTTLQKDNPLQWLRDWCLYYHRVHGVERVVLYDNGSAAALLPEHLSGLDAGLQVVVVNWDFPYGNHANHFCQHGSVNHCPRIFGDYSAYYLNFDVDEYLVNRTSQPLADYLKKHLTDRVSSLCVFGNGVPNITPEGKPAERVTDFKARFAGQSPEFTKTISRPRGVHYYWVHGGVPKMSTVALVIEMFQYIWESLHIRFGVWRPRSCSRYFSKVIRWFGSYSSQWCESGDLCYRHYQGLFKGWKSHAHDTYRNQFVAFDPAIHEADTEMQQLFEKHGIG